MSHSSLVPRLRSWIVGAEIDKLQRPAREESWHETSLTAYIGQLLYRHRLPKTKKAGCWEGETGRKLVISRIRSIWNSCLTAGRMCSLARTKFVPWSSETHFWLGGRVICFEAKLAPNS